MSDMTRPNPGPINAEAQRLLDLLADRATGGLSAPDQAEMEALLRRVPPLTDAAGRPITPESVDAAAASLMIALSSKPAPLPAEARARLLARGMEGRASHPAGRRTAARAGCHRVPRVAGRRGGDRLRLHCQLPGPTAGAHTIGAACGPHDPTGHGGPRVAAAKAL